MEARSIPTCVRFNNDERPLNWVRVEKIYDKLIDFSSIGSETLNIIYKKSSVIYHNDINRVLNGLINDTSVIRPDTIIKGIKFKVYRLNANNLILVDESNRAFMMSDTAMIYALSNDASENYFTNENGTNPVLVDVENTYPFSVKWINRSEINSQIMRITVETSIYDDTKANKKTFSITKNGAYLRQRQSSNPLVTFHNFGVANADTFILSLSGYLKSVSVTDSAKGQKNG